MRSIRLAAAAASLAFGAGAASASASTVGVQLPGPNGDDYRLQVDGGAGERNDVLFRFLAGPGTQHSAVIVRDAGAAVRPGPFCRSIDANGVQCTLPETGPAGGESRFGVLVRTGDGDDEVRFRTPPMREDSMIVEVDGGPGADALGAVALPLARTELVGGEGDDELVAGDGAGFGAFDGGAGDDRLVGGPRPDTLEGGAGEDTVSGRGGRDALYGAARFARVDAGDDEDTLDGGDGDDLLVGGPDEDSVTCDGGKDAVAVERRRDRVAAGCELVQFRTDEEFNTYKEMRARPFDWTATTARFRFPCLIQGPEDIRRRLVCRGSVTLREAGGRHRLLGRGAVPGRVARVRLTALGRSLFGRRRGVLATVAIRTKGLPAPKGWTVRLRRPR